MSYPEFPGRTEQGEFKEAATFVLHAFSYSELLRSVIELKAAGLEEPGQCETKLQNMRWKQHGP